MAGKKRFGISVPAEIAEKLDAIAYEVRADRSSLVVKAIEEYIHDELHYSGEHTCSGLLVLVGCGILGHSELGDLISIVKASCTAHLGGRLVTVLFVEGSYTRIALLRKALLRKSETLRYIPLECTYRRRRPGAKST